MQNAIILGSFKPNTWHKIICVVNDLEKAGVTILSPRCKNLIRYPLKDNPDFYYLEKDLEDTGLKATDIKDLTTRDITKKMDFRKLQECVCAHMSKQNVLTYVISREGKLGKSTSNELAYALLMNNSVAIDNKTTMLSIEVGPLVSMFLGRYIGHIPVIGNDTVAQSLPLFKKLNISITDDAKLELLKEIKHSLLRKDFVAYVRPVNEFTLLATS